MSGKIHLINGQEFKETEQARELLKATAGNDAEAMEHRRALAQVLQRAWRAGVLQPDTLDGIFDRVELEAGVDAKFPLDFYAPADSESDTRKAFVVPREGAIPDRVIEGDELHVITYKIANAISWSLDYARDARWDVIARAIEVYTNGFIRKLNDDGWHTVLSCAASNSVVVDSAGTSGVYSKRLTTNLQTAIKRLAGGRNSKVTDIYLSPEAIADIRNFDTGSAGGQIVDFETLKALLGTDGFAPLPSLFGSRVHELQELGTGQEYQDYLATTLGVSLPTGKEEFCVALDLDHRDSFVMPVRQDMSMFDDPVLHRQMKAGVYGWMEMGMACLDSRRAILGSL
ncbi:hypothetical protein KAR91_50080 [Candidatus Pacearchaeota archaeon]|nr:hypothetical protein [Candidatus Pacearchaeota archaeon]